MSHHVRMLERYGLLELVRKGQRRGAVEHYHRGGYRPVVSASVWGEMPTVAREAMLAGALGEVARSVTAAAEGGGFDRSDAHMTRSPLLLDDVGFARAAAVLDKALAHVVAITRQAERRRAARDHAGEVRALAVLMLFEEAAPAPTGDAG